jgi:hypothetical protein
LERKTGRTTGYTARTNNDISANVKVGYDIGPLTFSDRCKSLNLSFQSLSREIATRHSSHGGEFGERIDSVKDAEHRLRRRERSSRLPESTPPRRQCSAHGMNGEI